MLDLHIGLMLFVAALFLALLVVLNKILYVPMLKFMDDRDASIAKDLEAAKELGDDSASLVEEAQKLIAEAKQKAAAIRQKSIDEESRVAQSKRELKETELAEAYALFAKELEEKKAQLTNELLSQVPLFKESLKAKFSQL